METLWQDVKYGVRMLTKSPGFTVVALLALTLGIGANSAIFSLVNSILLRPLPYPEADRLIFFGEQSRQVPNMSISMANFNDFRDKSTVFDGMVAFRGQNYTMTGAGEPERLLGRQVTWQLFPTLKLQPIIGRGFGPEEDKVGAERVVLLSEAFWARRFARDPGVLNKQLVLNGESYTVIGVLPTNGFHATWRTADVFSSLWRLEDTLGGPNNRGNHPGIYAFARMKPGVTFAQAEAELKGIAERLAQEYPSNREQSASVQPLHDAVVGTVRGQLMVLLGAVGFVLLIACANVANLLLARAASRQKEIAVRTALGAGRMRLVRQMLTESVLLSTAGGAIGMFLAWASIRALVSAGPTTIPRLSEIALDGWVLAFTAGISVLTGLIFGLAPALHASKPEMAETLKEGSRGMSGSASRHRVRNSLVVAEISLALVLLVGAGLMLKSFANLTDADAGFRDDGVLVASVTLPQTKYPFMPVEKRQLSRDFNTRVIENIRALPGVEYAATTSPLLGGNQTSFHIQGTPIPQPGQAPSTDNTRVSPDYFKVMGVRLLKGRYFTEADVDGAPRVCIVDETLANTRWPNEDPIGKVMRFGSGQIQPGQDPGWMTVVGVVAHVKNYGVDQDSREETYVPHAQSFGGGTIVVKAKGDPAQLISPVRQAVLSVDPDVPIFGARTLASIVSDNVAPRRMSVNLLGGFAGLALLLAAVGIYGVMSYAVSQRTHEIGIRMALGAGRGDIFKLVVGQGMWLAGVGVVLGLLMAFGLAFGIDRFLSPLLFGVSKTDPATYALIPFVLIAVALGANYIPARRAMKVDPIIALRYE